MFAQHWNFNSDSIIAVFVSPLGNFDVNTGIEVPVAQLWLNVEGAILIFQKEFISNCSIYEITQQQWKYLKENKEGNTDTCGHF